MTSDPLFISVDIEVTHTDPVDGRLMQVGMVTSEGEEFEIKFGIKNTAHTSDWVREHLKPLLQECWEIQADILPHLVRKGVRRRHVCSDFASRVQQMHEWLEQLAGYGPSERPLVFIAYCGGLDWGFVSRAFDHCGFDNPFHYEYVEISSLAMGKLGMPWGFKGADLEAELDLAPLPPGKAHDALEDARHQLEVFRRLMAR